MSRGIFALESTSYAVYVPLIGGISTFYSEMFIRSIVDGVCSGAAEGNDCSMLE